MLIIDSFKNIKYANTIWIALWVKDIEKSNSRMQRIFLRVNHQLPKQKQCYPNFPSINHDTNVILSGFDLSLRQ